MRTIWRDEVEIDEPNTGENVVDDAFLWIHNDLVQIKASACFCIQGPESLSVESY